MLRNAPFAYLCVNCTRNLCFASVPNLSIALGENFHSNVYHVVVMLTYHMP